MKHRKKTKPPHPTDGHKLKALRRLVGLGIHARRTMPVLMAKDRAQRKKCARCVWPNRAAGVDNCPFPRCIEPDRPPRI